LLQCEECGCISRDRARAWLACLVRELEDVDEVAVEAPALAVYCPVCAAREELAPERASYT
jgi:hypothetical protein